MRAILPVALALLMLATPLTTQTKASDDAGAKNAQKARAALDAMVQALGGQAWLNMKNQMRQGHLAGFYHGKPDARHHRVLGVSCLARSRPHRVHQAPRRGAVLPGARGLGGHLQRQSAAAPGAGGRLSAPPRPLHRDRRQDLAQRSQDNSDLRGPAPGRAASGRPGDAHLRRKTRPSPS